MALVLQRRGGAMIGRFLLCCALLLLAALALLFATPGAGAQGIAARASLIAVNRLLFDADFAPYDVQGWLVKRGSPLAALQVNVGGTTKSAGEVLATAAADQGVNPKALLTWLELRGGLESGSPSFGLTGASDFAAQANAAAKLLREGLWPVNLHKPFALASGATINDVAFADAGSYALARALAAASANQDWATLTGLGDGGFVATYQRLFGEDPRVAPPLAPAAAPFLYPPLTVAFEHRSYFDHTYPTVDEGSDGNSNMTSYDGVLGRNYDEHDGHDYNVPVGTPVYAAAAGTAYFRQSNDCGDPNTFGVIIRHGDNYETLYWHMSSLAGTPGSSRAVQKGDYLGNSGQSGCANMPHLHFEVRHNGLASDPYGWTGGGSDPCPALVNGPSGYAGCEASAYIWAVAPDGNPQVPQPTATRTPTRVPTPTPPAATPTPCGSGATYVSSDVNKPVPPSGTTGTTLSTLQINNGPTIASVSVVGVNIEHSWASDLDVYLISPLGTRVELLTDVCDMSAWLAGSTGFALSDGAATTIGSTCPPGSATYKPEGSLNTLLGQPSSGAWTLEVNDDAYYDSGTLKGWGLQINGSGCGVAAGCGTSFADVQPSDYFYDPVRLLLCRGILSGYADNTFRPYSPVTRAQMLKMVALAENWSLISPAQPTFRDTQPGDWFYSYVETAVSKQVVSGYSDNTFRPGNPVNRGQTAKIIVLAAGWFLAEPAHATFSDAPADNPFYTYIETAVVRHIMSGYADGAFHPFDLAIRAQIAKMLYIRLGASAN